MNHGLIAFEGLDGSGKTSQMERLEKTLRERGIHCAIEREPSDGPVGSLLRQALGRKLELREETLALLFAADRVEHIHGRLLPLLRQGGCVLCDRYVYSSLAYQGVTNPPALVYHYNQAAIDALLPGLTVYIDVEPDECLRRITRTREGHELFEERERLIQVRAGFERAFATLADRTTLLRVDGNQEEQSVASAVLDGVWAYLCAQGLAQ